MLCDFLFVFHKISATNRINRNAEISLQNNQELYFVCRLMSNKFK